MWQLTYRGFGGKCSLIGQTRPPCWRRCPRNLSDQAYQSCCQYRLRVATLRLHRLILHRSLRHQGHTSLHHSHLAPAESTSQFPCDSLHQSNSSILPSFQIIDWQHLDSIDFDSSSIDLQLPSDCVHCSLSPPTPYSPPCALPDPKDLNWHNNVPQISKLIARRLSIYNSSYDT